MLAAFVGVVAAVAARAGWWWHRIRSRRACDGSRRAGGTVLTGDLADLRALAQHASDVTIEAI
jgi:hypothetical protein